MLIEVNGLDPDNFESWVFCPGMLFGSPDKWWGDLGRRDFPHEGIDFCLYADRSRQIQRLGEQTRIPVMHTGVVGPCSPIILARPLSSNTTMPTAKMENIYRSMPTPNHRMAFDPA